MRCINKMPELLLFSISVQRAEKLLRTNLTETAPCVIPVVERLQSPGSDKFEHFSYCLLQGLSAVQNMEFHIFEGQHKSGSLLPCIAAHAMIDAFSLIGADNMLVDWICIGATVLGSIGYCIYLSRLRPAEKQRD